MKIKEMIPVILFFIFVIIGFIYLSKSSIKTRKKILDNGKVTIGTIIRYKKSNHTPGSSSGYEYSFFDYSKKKHISLFEKTGNLIPEQKSNIKNGDKFLVIYLLKEGSLILFDYPIKDSTDFKRYVKEFEEMRKQKAKE